MIYLEYLNVNVNVEDGSQCSVVSGVGCHQTDLKQDFLTHLVDV